MMTTLEYNISAVAGFLRELQEEKFPTCARWDEDPRDCHCYHCRIEHYARLAEEAIELAKPAE
jgi:hypothetical protein